MINPQPLENNVISNLGVMLFIPDLGMKRAISVLGITWLIPNLGGMINSQSLEKPCCPNLGIKLFILNLAIIWFFLFLGITWLIANLGGGAGGAGGQEWLHWLQMLPALRKRLRNPFEIIQSPYKIVSTSTGNCPKSTNMLPWSFFDAKSRPGPRKRNLGFWAIAFENDGALRFVYGHLGIEHQSQIILSMTGWHLDLSKIVPGKRADEKMRIP